MSEEDQEEKNLSESLEFSQERNTQEEHALPDGWISVVHESGGKLYLHRDTRVCTWSKPYYVSTSRTIKKHNVPVDSIPCIREWLESSQEKQRQVTKRIESLKLSEYLTVRWPSGFPLQEEIKTEVVSKREKRKRKANTDDLIVPKNISKVITVNVPKKYIKSDSQGKRSSSVWKVNVFQKPPVSILLEFCQHYLRNEVNYECKENAGNRLMPYDTMVVIGGVQYGHGSGATKRISKQAAAKATLDLFLPGAFSDSSSEPSNKEFEYFATVPIDDIQSITYLQQTGLPSPWSILKDCCQRMKGIIGLTEPELKIELVPQSDGASSVQAHYTLTCGPDYTVTGLCNGRKDGQQLAAQKMLKLLHPDLHTWDSLLTLYIGTQSQSKIPKIAEKDSNLSNNEQIQSSTDNRDLLLQLKTEMRSLLDQCHNV